MSRKKTLPAQLKHDAAVKYDGTSDGLGKLRYDLVPVRALEEVVKIFNYGAKKYPEPRNWEKGLTWGRVYGALQRHSSAFWKGQTYDRESKLPHLAHAAWCCLALLEYMRTHPELDDRPSLAYKKRKKRV